MSAEGWISEVLEGLATRCPVVSNILSTLVENSIQPGKKNPAICLIYGIVMFLRCDELSRIQQVNSVLCCRKQSLNTANGRPRSTGKAVTVKTIEINLFQENRNSEMKKLVRAMGANKTEKQINIHPKSTTHSQKSAINEERAIRANLRSLRPFRKEERIQVIHDDFPQPNLII